MTLTIASGPIRQAIYALLTAAAITQPLVAGGTGPAVPIFDVLNVPTNQAFPYIVLNSILESMTDNLTTRGRTLLAQIDVLSRYRGTFEVDGIREQIVAALDRQQAAMVAPGLSIWRCAFLQKHDNVFADGLTIQGVVEFRIDCQDAS